MSRVALMLFPSPRWGGRNLRGDAAGRFCGNDHLCGRRPAEQTMSSTSPSQDLHGPTTDLATSRPLYDTVVKIMPVVEASGDSSKTIAALFAIPVLILFLSVWLAVTCSERWNQSDNRVKRYLERQGRASLSGRSVDEEAHT
jgi:hypothetical protein